MAPQSPFEDVQGKDVTFPNLSPFGPQLRTREDNDVESIVNNVLRKGHFTILSQKGFQDPKAEALNRISCDEHGGCIFFHRRLCDIFDNDRDATVSPNNYDVVIIIKDYPIFVLTVTRDDGIDEDIIQYNRRLSCKLRRFLLNFTDQNITTLCAVVKASVLNDEQELIEIMKTKREEAAELLIADKLYMDEKKRDDATLAFITSLSFLHPKRDSDIRLHPRAGKPDVLFCMRPVEFFQLYAEPRRESKLSLLSLSSDVRRTEVPWRPVYWMLIIFVVCLLFQILRGSPEINRNVDFSVDEMIHKTSSIFGNNLWHYSYTLHFVRLNMQLQTKPLKGGSDS